MITYYEYLIGYLDEVIRPLVLILPKLGRYVKTFKVKDGVKDKSNKLMSFRMDDDKLLEKYKIICTKVEDLQNNRLNDLPIYDDRYLKTKIRTQYEKSYTNFHDLNVSEDGEECQFFTIITYWFFYFFMKTNIQAIFFTIISIGSLLVYENKYLDNCAYEIVDNQMTDYLDDNLFKPNKDQFLTNGSYKCCILIKSI